MRLQYLRTDPIKHLVSEPEKDLNLDSLNFSYEKAHELWSLTGAIGMRFWRNKERLLEW